MKLLILVLLTVTSCSSYKAEPTPSLISTQPTKIRLNAMGNIEQKLRFNEISRVVEKLINSDKFKNEILSLKFKDTKDTSEEVYNKIMLGSEEFKFFADRVWDVNIKFEKISDKKDKNGNLIMTLGYTYMGFFYDTIYLNTLYIDRLDSLVAETFCHEYFHKLGYIHENDESYESVPLFGW